MYFQQRFLEESKTFGGLAGLDTIDLPKSGLLSGIEFYIYGVCGTGAADPDVWLYDRLTKIEVIANGSQVIKSYSGEQLLAMMCYKKTGLWSHDMKNMSGASCEVFLYVNFGRFYHDTEYALDLDQLNDPEIRLTYAFAATSTHGWTNGTAMTVTPSRSTVCHLIVEPDTPPLGYIRTTELYRHTSGVSKLERMTIPKGAIFSNLYLQSWYVQQGFGVILDKVSLDLDMGRIIPFEVGPQQLAAENLRQYGMFEMMLQLSAKGGQVYPMPFEQGFLGPVTIGLINAMQSAMDMWANYSSFSFRDTSDGVTPETGNTNIQAYLKGIWPFSVAALPYFDPMNKATWLDTNKFSEVAVVVKETASGGTNLTLKLIGDEVVTRYL